MHISNFALVTLNGERGIKEELSVSISSTGAKQGKKGTECFEEDSMTRSETK